MNNQSIKNGFLMTAWGYLIPAIAAIIFIIVICSKAISIAVEIYEPTNATATTIDPDTLEKEILPTVTVWSYLFQAVTIACGLLTGCGLLKAAKASDNDGFSGPLSSLATMVFIYTGLSFLVSAVGIISPSSKLGLAISGALAVFSFCFYFAYIVRGKNCTALAYENSQIAGLRTCSRGYQMMWIGFAGIIVAALIIIYTDGTGILTGLIAIAAFALSIVMLAGYIQVIIGWFKAASAATTFAAPEEQ